MKKFTFRSSEQKEMESLGFETICEEFKLDLEPRNSLVLPLMERYQDQGTWQILIKLKNKDLYMLSILGGSNGYEQLDTYKIYEQITEKDVNKNMDAIIQEAKDTTTEI